MPSCPPRNSTVPHINSAWKYRRLPDFLMANANEMMLPLCQSRLPVALTTSHVFSSRPLALLYLRYPQFRSRLYPSTSQPYRRIGERSMDLTISLNLPIVSCYYLVTPLDDGSSSTACPLLPTPPKLTTNLWIALRLPAHAPSLSFEKNPHRKTPQKLASSVHLVFRP